MSNRGHGQIRRSQVITTFGPGALIDLPYHSAIIGGLDTWTGIGRLDQIIEPRMSRILQAMTGVGNPGLYPPPPEPEGWQDQQRGIGAWRFPEWFIVQEVDSSSSRWITRRMVHRTALDDQGRFEKKSVVATRFVRACPKGHVDDINWYDFVHDGSDPCRRDLSLEERGTSGDLSDQVIRCSCGKSRRMHEAADIGEGALGACLGARPWLGRYANETCGEVSRLLVRTASNAWFPQVLGVLSLPDRGSAVDQVVNEFWHHLQIATDAIALGVIKRHPEVANHLAKFSDDEVLAAILARQSGGGADQSLKHAELDALLAAPEGFGDDVPIDPDFHARRLPESVWRHLGQFDVIESVIQVHRLREVLALAGFTRFEAVMPDINGEYESDVTRADIALEPEWFPAVENRGEGIFVQLSASAIQDWLERSAVKERLAALGLGHAAWVGQRKSDSSFPGGPYVLLHTLAHLLIQSLAMRCGYPAASIRERIFVDQGEGRFALLLYTASPDAEGTLGGLVQEARRIEDHMQNALDAAALCSNDPVCAEHAPSQSLDGRWLHGAACHGCALIAETSCEMRNEYLDRALVAPVLGQPDAAFFSWP